MLERSVILFLIAVAISSGAPSDTPVSSEEAKVAIARVLDDFHDAASKADGARYFAHLAPDAVFLGTDASERWTKDAFRAFAEPYFSKGKGWTYVPKDRHIDLAPGGAVAWFDEKLENAKYGECRGTGVLRHIDGAWRIAQYNLTIPIPNELSAKVVEMIRAQPGDK
jgi:ketosteroid isomerase-like protein